MHNELLRLAEVVTDLPLVEGSPDPADNFLLSMAQAGEAAFLVTGDKSDLLSIATYGHTRIVTARQMLEELGGKRRTSGTV
jgi:predicted nucleic acid-binding protein